MLLAPAWSKELEKHLTYMPFVELSIIFRDPNPPLAEFAGGSRRWARRRTRLLQVPTNKADPVKSASPRDKKIEGTPIQVREITR